jgi:hypothetical protein
MSPFSSLPLLSSVQNLFIFLVSVFPVYAGGGLSLAVFAVLVFDRKKILNTKEAKESKALVRRCRPCEETAMEFDSFRLRFTVCSLFTVPSSALPRRGA